MTTYRFDWRPPAVTALIFAVVGLAVFLDQLIVGADYYASVQDLSQPVRGFWPVVGSYAVFGFLLGLAIAAGMYVRARVEIRRTRNRRHEIRDEVDAATRRRQALRLVDGGRQ